MPYNKIIRHNAARIIKKNMPVCIGLTFIFLLILIIRTTLSGMVENLFGNNAMLENLVLPIFSAAVNLTVVFPLTFGIARWFWRLTFDVKDNPGEIFYFFSDKIKYTKAFLMGLVKSAPIFVQILFLKAAPISEKMIQKLPGKNLFVLTAVDSVFTVLNFAVTIFAIWLLLKLFLSDFLIFNDDNLSVTDALKLSFKIGKGKLAKIIGFHLGFIGWIWLSVLIIPLAYTYPLLLTAQAVFAQSLIIRYNYDLKMKGNVKYAG